MTEDRMALLELLREDEEPADVTARDDVLRRTVQWLVQELMEAEVSAHIGAGRYECSDNRATQRNGYRPRSWDTRLGTLPVQIPKLRTSSYFPSEPAPRQRRLDAEYPYVWLDARSEHVREEGRVRSMAARGGSDAPVAIAPSGLKQAISAVFVGAAWQCCPRRASDGHFLRNVPAHVAKRDQAMGASSPTARRPSASWARCWPNRTTNGWWDATTSAIPQCGSGSLPQRRRQCHSWTRRRRDG